MQSRVGWRLLAGLCVLMSFLALGASGAMAAFHGVAQAKQCVGPVRIGGASTCAAQIANTVDTGHDTIRVSGLIDTVNSAGGAVATGNILSSTVLIFNFLAPAGTPSPICVGGSGAGTNADPYLGATECLLPFGSNITTRPFSHYTVQAADFNLPLHRLTDTVTWKPPPPFRVGAPRDLRVQFSQIKRPASQYRRRGPRG